MTENAGEAARAVLNRMSLAPLKTKMQQAQQTRKQAEQIVADCENRQVEAMKAYSTVDDLYDVATQLVSLAVDFTEAYDQDRYDATDAREAADSALAEIGTIRENLTRAKAVTSAETKLAREGLRKAESYEVGAINAYKEAVRRASG